MRLNQLLVSVIAVLGLNSVVMAQADTSEKSQKNSSLGTSYIGADWGLFNSTKLDFSNSSIKNSSSFGDFGYNAVVGYEFNVDKSVKIGVEAEYRHFGKVSEEDEFSVKGSGVYLNIKPKFIVHYQQADAYLSLLGGIGSVNLKGNVASDGLSISQSELGYQLGVELGFIINKNINLHVGYRSTSVEIKPFDVSISSGYGGIRYYF
ncbi:outer membrane beta-barrel protein [Vibrio metschnikovii]|uniref:outer membrane beta-barrel protein n=1 Tax=Vibrio metschnikovii TaxID=28172 RepID=UPI00130225A8|nr:outer membrane beta-barrel protein [Vibrio metschnikovii]EKO3594372.1 outer membrane beta-barrel protein [Vibrio metschnikovii]EKO3656959.1 outer membrane beta-barrel protein [Vibrio metschnikovii]EKO3667736.1 outer membrane beta-barrel protein [Vibrio metschnikovii]